MDEHDEKMNFTYQSGYKHFKIEVTKSKPYPRPIYPDIRILFSIKITCSDFSDENFTDWKVNIKDAWGRINKIEDSDELVEILKTEIKKIIDYVELGESIKTAGEVSIEASIDERILDLTK
ncbi:MAG: hypothetical protein UW34_C0016G0005 [Parcubacteria group bacterium GW2011_GWA2_44_15]|nr:MAG: hypothetical protein UW34_C0016G0005 [Parcubacteria group bacterium GW2011_GWA2_44_15]